MFLRQSFPTFVLALGALVAVGACKSGKPEAGASSASTAAGGAAAGKPPAGLPGQSDADLTETVAVIDGTPLTVAEVQDRINKQSPYVRARYTSLEQKKEFLDNMVRLEVLAAEARKRGYDKDAEVVRTMKQVMIQRLMKEEFDTRVKPDDVTEAEMKKFYDEHLSDYNKPEEVRVSAIIVKDKAKAQKAAAEAKLPANADAKMFRDLVTKYSDDEETKSRGGDLRFFTADATTVPAPVAKASFELKNQGDVAGPVETPSGFYIIKQAGVRKAISKSFDEVKRQIQNRLYRDKRQKAMQDFESDLKTKAKVELHPDVLAKVKIDTTSTPPGAEEGGPGSPHGGGVPGGLVSPTPGSPAPAPGAPPAAPPATTPAPANPAAK
jgi:peptidyl-prolyl cis-trans isomerase C